MRVALKIAYDGGAFFGHQRQPDRRTVEGECLAALRAGKVVRDPLESFFRSASRTDRGVSAVGNVIAFDSALRPDAVVGVFNNHAQGVWAWACSDVPPTFHPRHAIERWYRYHLYGDLRVDSLREVGALFLGDRDFRSFTSEPLVGPFALNRLEVRRDRDAIVVDVRAGSFRRGMVRRIVAAMVAFARGEVALDTVRTALEGRRFRPAPLPDGRHVWVSVSHRPEAESVRRVGGSRDRCLAPLAVASVDSGVRSLLKFPRTKPDLTGRFSCPSYKKEFENRTK